MSDSDSDCDFITSAASKTQVLINESLDNLQADDPLRTFQTVWKRRSQQITTLNHSDEEPEGSDVDGYHMKESPIPNRALLRILAARERVNKRLSFSGDDDCASDDSDVSDDESVTSESDNGSKPEPIIVKVRWRHEIYRMVTSQTEFVSTFADRFAEQVGAKPSHIVLFLEGKRLNREEKMGLFKLDVTKFIDARTNAVVEIKIQDAHGKNVTMQVATKLNFAEILSQYLRRQNLEHLRNCKFFFDADIVNPQSTPADLQLNGGERIDFYHDTD